MHRTQSDKRRWIKNQAQFSQDVIVLVRNLESIDETTKQCENMQSY